MELSDVTTGLQSFANAQLVEGCIQSQDKQLLPYPQYRINKLFVRKCLDDVFVLLMGGIGNGVYSPSLELQASESLASLSTSCIA